jgi:hypothetical protein
MTFAHHDAAGRDQRSSGEAELVGAEQRTHHHVAAGADAAVDLHRDAPAQPVGDQRLMGLGEADLPGRAGVRRLARPAAKRLSSVDSVDTPLESTPEVTYTLSP